MSKPFLILQHAEAEGPGLLAQALAAAGFALRVVRTDRGEAVPPAVAGFAGIVVMGGSMGVYETGRHPHLADEIDRVREALARGVPVLGICLGAQILAAAAGARVYPGPEKEIGWAPVRLLPAGAADPVLRLLPDGAVVFHWHGDTFDLPPGAALLASSERYAHQAFRVGQAAYGLQFHPEVTVTMVDAFVAAGAGELEAAHGPVGARRLREGARRHAAALARRVPRLVGAFLLASGLARPAQTGAPGAVASER